MVDFSFNVAKLQLADGRMSLTTEGAVAASSFFAMLVSTGYTNVAQDTRDNDDNLGVAGLSTNLPSFYEPSTTTGYERQAIGASTVTQDDTANRAVIDTTDIVFASVSSGAGIAGVIGGMLIFAELAANDSSGRRPVSMYETGFPISANGGDINIAFSTAGWLNYATTS